MIDLYLTQDGLIGPTGKVATLSTERQTFTCAGCEDDVRGQSVVTGRYGVRGRQRYGLCCVGLHRNLWASNEPVPENKFFTTTTSRREVIEMLRRTQWDALFIGHRLNAYEMGAGLIVDLAAHIQYIPKHVEVASRSLLVQTDLNALMDKHWNRDENGVIQPFPAKFRATYRLAIFESHDQVRCDWCGSVQAWGIMTNTNCRACRNRGDRWFNEGFTGIRHALHPENVEDMTGNLELIHNEAEAADWIRRHPLINGEACARVW